MASDLSSGCTEAIEVFDEKEEGEISLEDVSSSEEGHVTYGYGNRISQCPNCLSTQHCASWCTATSRVYHHKAQSKKEVDIIPQDAVQGKENRHHTKDSGCTATKHSTSTLQERNDDLVPISSDSDMEIVGLTDNSKQLLIRSASKSRAKKKKKKKRSHSSVLCIDDLVSPSTVDATECSNILQHDAFARKGTHASRSHHRELSPLHRSNRARNIARSPPRRHRSPAKMRSPFKKSRSPVIHTRLPPLKRSPHRTRSPKRSPYHSPVRTSSRKVFRSEQSSSTDAYIDMYNMDMLKKVRHLDSVGAHSMEASVSRNKEHVSSLKEKLCNMMKGISDSNGNVTNYLKEKSCLPLKDESDVDEDEDLALLRQKALETKQSKYNKCMDYPNNDMEKRIGRKNDDQDEEDLQLRMIALRSAVLKKHQNRVLRGVKSGSSKKSSISRSESPFNLDTIPVPVDNCTNSISPPCTPPNFIENSHAEDMELDTDIERENEILPYSPTDKMTSNMPIDTELLGIQPSDVSFINLNQANIGPLFNTSHTRVEHATLNLEGKENRNYLPITMEGMPFCTNEASTYQMMNIDIPYSPSDPTETPDQDYNDIKKQHSRILPCVFSETTDITKTVQSWTGTAINDTASNQDVPYSPTDTPIYDPDLSRHAQLSTSFLSSLSEQSQCNNHFQEDSAVSKSEYIHNKSEVCQSLNNLHKDLFDKLEAPSACPVMCSATSSYMDSISPNGSMITIDDLPETDIDDAPQITTPKNENIENTSQELPHETAQVAQESLYVEGIPDDAKDINKIPTLINRNFEGAPLYMQGIPDVTKDVNKIPTLINRTLVPVPILKSNKQLQQPLPAKKCDIHTEPTFKSADMHPVIVNAENNIKPNTIFKPIKLVSFAKKANSVLSVANAFAYCLNEDSESGSENLPMLESGEQHSASIQNTSTTLVGTPVSNSETVSNTGKKKRTRSSRRKHQSEKLKNKKCNTAEASCILKQKDKCNRHKTLQTDIVKEKQKENQELLDSLPNNSITTDVSKIEVPLTNADTCNLNNTEIQEHINDKNQECDSSSENTLQMHWNNMQSINETQNTTDRRQSMDEDADELRAILLASLANRTKSTKNSNSVALSKVTSTTVTGNTCATISHNLNEVLTSRNIANRSTENNNTSAYSKEASDGNLFISSKDNIITDQPSNNVVEKSCTVSPIAPAKKRVMPMAKGPPKKVIKKLTIPASTKVVNNAKKYQNTKIHKRLNSQKVAHVYSIQNLTEKKFVKSKEKKWSSNPITSDMQRIVINLESDTESESESERQKAHSDSLKLDETEKRPTLTIPTTEFEKSVDQFLRDVRKKQESAAIAKPSISSHVSKKAVPKEDCCPSHLTPLAVRHLPASQQAEYRRLKQQIIERERLKLQIVAKNTNLNQAAKTVSQSISTDTSKKEQSISKTCQQTLNSQSPSKSSEDINLKNMSARKNTLNTVNTKSTKPPVLHLKDSKGTMKSITNFSICITNQISSPQNDTCNKQPENSKNSVDEMQKTLSENKILNADIGNKVSPCLKILTKDELNRKYVQIQVKHNATGRVVTINNKENNIVVNKGTTLDTNNSVNKTMIDNTNVTENVEHKDKSVSHANKVTETVDSDASTVRLSEDDHSLETSDYQTSECTIRPPLSEDERDDSRVSSIDRRNDYCVSPKSSIIWENKGKSMEETWDTVRKDATTELNALINLPQSEQKQHLMEIEHKLVMKRYTVLEDLSEMSGNLRQWDMERDLQTNLVAEVKKLREQLKMAEERLQLQRNCINSMGPKLVTAYEKMSDGRQECVKLLRICCALGKKINGPDYKVPDAGEQLLDNKLKEVASHTRKLSKKKVPFINIPNIYAPSTSHKYPSTVQTQEKCNEEQSLINSSDERNVHTESKEERQTPLSQEVLGLNNMTLTPTEALLSTEDKEVESTSSLDRLNDIPQQQPTISVVPPISNTITLPNNEIQECNEIVLNSGCDIPIDPCNIDSDTLKSRSNRQMKKFVEPYVSVLTHFNLPRNTNPNGILCPYELMGTCSDGDCHFIHQSTCAHCY